MNNLNSITDEEFIPFLHSLGVDTYNKSFEWMLSDPEFGEVLRWIYNNVDQKNALSAREECRYAEIEKKGNLLSTEDLEATLTTLQQEYPGITLPGDNEALEDVRMNITMQKERLSVLEKQDKILKDMIAQNEVIKQELDKEVIKLNAAQRQCDEDESAAAAECLQLAEEVDAITNTVVDVIADTLNVYRSCSNDMETAKRFLTFGPFDTYRQSQGLFRSHFDQYITKKFDKRSDDVTGDDLRAALVEAKHMEERLSDAISEYIDSKVELSGEQAKLALVTNYSNIHPSQITSSMMEAQSSLELLEQEESILDQQMKTAAQELVASRTRLVVDTATHAALTVREQVSADLSFLLDITRQAVCIDRLVYGALRHELRDLEDLVTFAAHFNTYVVDERVAVASRMQSMNEITLEHESVERRLQTSDTLRNTLCSVLQVETRDPLLLVQRYNELLNRVRELRESALEGVVEREKSLKEFKHATTPLHRYVFDGSTGRANCYDRCLSGMRLALRAEIEAVDSVVLDASGLFHTVKNGDKRNMRKLWQWFLTEPSKLFAALNNVHRRS